MFMLILDDGHGVETPGKRTPTGTKENQFNSAVVAKVKSIAEERGINVLLTAPEIADIPLKTRTDRANIAYSDLKPSDKCVMVSIHYNAHLSTFEGSNASGVETLYSKADSKYLAECIHENLIMGTQQVNRKVKLQNLHMTRETKMPSVLIECGFMDDPREAALMLDDAFQSEVATEVVKGLCKFFGTSFDTVKPGIASWKTDGLRYLYENNLINDYDGWLAKIDEPLPAWAVFTITANAHRKSRV